MQNPESIPRTPVYPADARRKAAAEDPDHPIRTLYCVHCGDPLPVQMSCGDRTCPKCRRKWYGYHFKALLDCVSRWKDSYFLTLTIKNIPDKAFGKYNVADLRKWFTKLRRRFPLIVGGFYAIQTTNRGEGWHLHLHSLFDGSFISQKSLSKVWREITGGSFIVDIRKVTDPKTAVRYLLSDFMQSPRIRPEDRDAFNGVFKGSRLIQPFGKYRSIRFRVPYKCPKCGWSSWVRMEDLLNEKNPVYQDDA